MKSVHIWSFSAPYLVRKRGNTDQKNSEYKHFSRSEVLSKKEPQAAIYKGHFIVISTALVTKVSLVNESNPTKEKIS